MLAMNFRIMFFGDFLQNVDEFDMLEYCVFAVFSIVILVLSMNLLISIISDSFDRVWS